MWAAQGGKEYTVHSIQYTVQTFSWLLLSFAAESSASGPQSGKAPYHSLTLPHLFYLYISGLHQFILRRLGSSDNCSVIPACDLLTGRNNTSPEDALSAFSSWGTVHGSGAQYTRMALTLVDNHFGSAPLPAPRPTPQAATAGQTP